MATKADERKLGGGTMTVLCKNCSPRKQCTADKNRTECRYYQPTTNEEWFCGLSTEEKAKYIAKSMFFYDSQFGLTMVEALRKSVEYEDGLNETIEHDVVEWLKQLHK